MTHETLESGKERQLGYFGDQNSEGQFMRIGNSAAELMIGNIAPHLPIQGARHDG